MKSVTLFSFLCFCAVLQISRAEKDFSLNDFISQLVRIAIYYVEILLKNKGTFQLMPGDSISFDNSLVEGSLSMEGINLYGFDTLEVKKEYIKIDLDIFDAASAGTLYLGLTLPIEETGVKIGNYGADVGLNKTIPLYGAGDISFKVTKVKVDFQIELNIKGGLKLTHFELRPYLGGSKIELTGFFNNPELSGLISNILSLVPKIIVIIWDLGLDCSTCAISTIVESLFNGLNVVEQLKIRCKAACPLFIHSSVEFEKMLRRNDATKFLEIYHDSDAMDIIISAKDFFVSAIKELNN